MNLLSCITSSNRVDVLAHEPCSLPSRASAPILPSMFRVNLARTPLAGVARHGDLDG